MYEIHYITYIYQNTNRECLLSSVIQLPFKAAGIIDFHGRRIMAINLTHRPDLEIRIERLSRQLKLTGRGGKTGTIERALDALEEKLESERPNREHVYEVLMQIAADGKEVSEQMYRDNPHFRGKPLSQALQDELYNDDGLPE